MRINSYPALPSGFPEIARAFCAWVESDRHEVERARRFVLELLVTIPDPLTPPDAEMVYPGRSPEEHHADFRRFADLPFQYYRQLLSLSHLDEDPPAMGDLHEDLAEIYGELWHGLKAFDNGDMAYARHHWRWSYDHHWGRHASAALNALDEYRRSPWKCE